MNDAIFKITPTVESLSELAIREDSIAAEFYSQYDVKRGLRDINGDGVITGLTNISEVHAKKLVDGQYVPCEGELFYRGHEIRTLTKGFLDDNRLGFEEIAYLLLVGKLPTQQQLDEFKVELASRRALPRNFVRDVIMKAPAGNLMINLSKSILTLYSYDDRADDCSVPNVMRQCLNLISQFPMIAVYSNQAYMHSIGRSLHIISPDKELSTAENILMMLRPNKKFTALEAKVLDLALVLHMDHGGGNNSAFTTRVVTSSGTDTYSVFAAALGSLKGPKHGGANIKVVEMFKDLKKEVKDWKDDEEIESYLKKVLHKEAFDRSGLVYGVGHAVYSVSDPRAEIFREFVSGLAKEKGKEDEFELYRKVEVLAPKLITSERRIYKGVSTNVDFYSGFVYKMLNLPEELFTPMFAVARLVGWSANRIEEIVSDEKIIRPAYKCVIEKKDYVPLNKR